MRWVFAVSLVLGMFALIGLVMLRGSRGKSSDRWQWGWGPSAVAAAVAFGMGGLSASYAGGNLWLATLAALVAAVLAAWYARTVEAGGGEEPD
ncbi:MAG: hypothetical protein RI637_04270 [Acidimicrobiia bacterium]|jgi:hypothetical protein|nr:hypothetical protein [Acidimicrobiia bacterium]